MVLPIKVLRPIFEPQGSQLWIEGEEGRIGLNPKREKGTAALTPVRVRRNVNGEENAQLPC